MKIDLGNFLLALAWLMSSYGFVAGVYGASRKREAASASAANAVVLMGLFSFLSLAALGTAFLSGDYRYEYVWQNSNNAMYAPYRMSAIWGGMSGSMLLWATFMALFAMVVVWRSARVPVLLMRWVVPVLAIATNFFLAVTLFLTNPFKLIPTDQIPTDGSGLNPLLQNPSMLIHPPFLYLGFTGFSVPFAFCMGALLSRQLSDNWIRLTRLSTLIAWGFLTVGIILGGHWAYIELGWGGFWAWDPVENASFLPWLTGTAFLHSVMVQQRRGMLKVWNASLAILTYALTVLGTFITRSGVVQSVHAFSNSDVGWVFLVYLAVLIVVSVVLIAWRWKDLRPEHQFESFFSRETAFLFNNLVLLAICFATAWGVLFPLVSEALSGEKSVVGPPFFNRVNVPLFIALMFLMGVGPLIAWRKASLSSLWKTFRVPFFSGSIITAIFLVLDSTRIYTAVSFGLALFVIATIEAEFRRAAKARSVITSSTPMQSGLKLFARRPQKWGGFLVHLGVAVMCIAITASMAYKVEKDFTLKTGDKLRVGNYELELLKLSDGQRRDYSILSAEVAVRRAGESKVIGTLRPEKRFYPRTQQSTTEVDIRMTMKDDLYIALAGLDMTDSEAKTMDLVGAKAAFKVFINPLQVWLWVGALVVLLGTLVVLRPLLSPLLGREVTEEEVEIVEMRARG